MAPSTGPIRNMESLGLGTMLCRAIASWSGALDKKWRGILVLLQPVVVVIGRPLCPFCYECLLHHPSVSKFYRYTMPETRGSGAAAANEEGGGGKVPFTHLIVTVSC